jgi:hypothetical protein
MADNLIAAGDIELLGLATRFNQTLAIIKSMEGIAESKAFEAICLDAFDLVRQIAFQHATTLAGLKAKAQALIWACEYDDLDSAVAGEFMEDIMPASVARDLLAINESTSVA